MVLAKLASRQPYVLSLLRIVAGFCLSLHGFQKFFGVLGGRRAAAGSLVWFAGVLECFGGTLVFLGLFTRSVAFILSGEMAVAYFYRHLPKGFWPILNGGELAAIYAFVYLYLAAAGGGPWTVGRLWRGLD